MAVRGCTCKTVEGRTSVETEFVMYSLFDGQEYTEVLEKHGGSEKNVIRGVCNEGSVG